MAVYHGINGKITVSGNVIGGCNSCEISTDREISEFGAIGASTKELAAGQRTVNFTLNGAWAGSRWLPILQGTGSNWNVIMEMTGGAVMIASGCICGGATWNSSSDGISTEVMKGRAVDVFASGVSLN